MSAAVYDVAGGPEVLREAEVADPVCADDGVVMAVEALSIEGGDLIHRAMMPPPHAAGAGGVGLAAIQLAHQAEVRRLTSGRGADLVVDPVRSTLAALKPEGRWVFAGW